MKQVSILSVALLTVLASVVLFEMVCDELTSFVDFEFMKLRHLKNIKFVFVLI